MTPLSHNRIRKVRPLVAATLILSTLPISFAVSTFAQEKDAVDQQTGEPATYYGDGWLASWSLLQQLEAASKKYDEAFNNYDAAALAAFYTEDGVIVTDRGPLYGRQAIEKWFAGLFKAAHPKNHISKLDPNSFRIVAATNNIALNGEWNVTFQGQNGEAMPAKGYWSAIDTRQGNDWKIIMVTINVTPAPPKAAPVAETK